MANQLEATTVVTDEVRLSFVHLFQPYASQQGDEPKYSTTILIPKSDHATMQRIQAATAAAVQKGVAKGLWMAGAQPPTPIHDGDGVRPQGEPFGPECKGHWVMTASSKQQQSVVAADMSPIIDQTSVFSGVYGRVTINFYEYSNKRKGIGAGLGPVQILRSGEPLGGRISAEQAFGNVPAPQQQAYAQPQQQYQQPAPQQQQYQQPATQQQGYGQAPQQPPQQQYQQPAQQVDPITGKPLQGGVWGI